MAQEFKKRRGYDVTPWLGLVAADKKDVVIGSEEQMKRFQWDYRRTCSELVDEAYAGAARQAAKGHGLQLSIEAYGGAGWLNPLTYGAQCDVPMAEFWISRWGAWHLLSPRLLASVGHVFGQPVIGAESFTSGAPQDPYTEHPYSIKSTGDWAMSEGVNRFVFHRTALNPWPEIKPGMNFAGYGWHVDPAQTWWKTAGYPYFKYLARCQALLQQGAYVADVCRLVTEGEAHGERGDMVKLPGKYDALPPGYAYDYISDRALLSECSVEDGRIVTKNGKTSYRVIQLPNTGELMPDVLQKVAELVKAGVVVVGRAPERSPSLQGYPDCDKQVKDLAAEMWGTDPGADRGRQQYGAGRVAWGDAATSAIAVACDGADLTYTLNPALETKFLVSPTKPKVSVSATESDRSMPTDGLNWIHRRAEDGTDYYFVANPQYREVDALCSFRLSGKAPELWDAATGEMKTLCTYRRTAEGRTELPLHFEPAESVFVVFRATADAGKQVVELVKDGKVLFGEKAAGAAMRVPEVVQTTSGTVMVGAEPGSYKLHFGEGREPEVKVAESSAPLTIAGPWQVEFEAGRAAPEGKQAFTQLIDWTMSAVEGIKYFSGTATYRTEFEWTGGTSTGTRYTLSLGNVQVAADVTLNGKHVASLWKVPYQADVTDAVRPGKNQLEVRVSNRWPNRLIGDEQFPDDVAKADKWTSGPIPAWPEWLLKKQPRPEPRRQTFATWKYYTKESPLLPSGLLGPVEVRSLEQKVVSSGAQ
jgi:hypothetical protein